jgi:hypothetical protein
MALEKTHSETEGLLSELAKMAGKGTAEPRTRKLLRKRPER